MNAYRNYPAGYEPTAGPFKVITDEEDEIDRDEVRVEVNSRFNPSVIEVFSVESDDGEMATVFLGCAQARELAAALIECADYIERNAMTAEDIAKETRNRT